MLFMSGRVVDTIYTEELLLVFAIQSDKVGMEKTLLREFVLIADSVKIEASAEVLLLIDECVDVFNVLLLQ